MDGFADALVSGTAAEISLHRRVDLGIGGRNGVQLAVELRNAAGGIGGQPVELLVRDDGNDEEHARGMFREMVRAGAGVVIGPMTSAMAA